MKIDPFLRLGRAAALAACVASPALALADTPSDGAPRLEVAGGVDFTLNPFNDFFPGTVARIGGRLQVSAPSLVTYRLVGAEAALVNGFEVAGQRLFDAAQSVAGGSVERTVAATAGLLDFAFSIPHPQPGFRFVSNASNEAGRAQGFGVVMQGDRGARVMLDDYGWLDADYDDMVVEVSVTPIPEPAEWMIMAAGLLLAARTARRARGR